jgi:hypothetical protein
MGTATAEPTEGSGRGALLAREQNRGVHPFEVTDVTFAPASGTGGGIGVAGIPEPDPATGIACTIPGVVDGHSQGLIWMFVEDLAAHLDHDAMVQVHVGLGSGKVLKSEPFPMAGLIAARASQPPGVPQLVDKVVYRS